MSKLAALVAVAVVLIGSSARADDTTITLHTYVVYGRAPRPMAVTEVTKLPVTSTVNALVHRAVDNRIEQAVHAAPF